MTGILKSREQYMPVTCAILQEQERKDFFSALRKKVNGDVRRIAKAVDANAGTVSDWMTGDRDVPYLALQTLAHEFDVPMPSISELKREMHLIEEKARPRIKMPPAPTRRGRPRKESRKERGSGKRQKAKKETAGRQQGRKKQPKQQRQRQEKPARQPQPKAKPPKRKIEPSKDPKPSEQLAYWTGALLAGGRRENGAVAFAADRRIGQNFADLWAELTEEVFGVEPKLEMSEDNRVQTALIPSGEIDAFLDRIGYPDGVKPGSSPGAPRWAWSNPSWKTSFLKGLVDASSVFHRTPSIRIQDLSEELRKSASKMLSSFGISLKEEGGALVIEGRSAVEKYHGEVGTSNLKLRDQLKAYLGGGRGGESGRRGGRRGGRGGKRRGK